MRNIYNKLGSNNYFKDLVNNFRDNAYLNLNFQMGDIPNDKDGNVIAGKTSHTYGTTNFTITINNTYFNNTTVGGLEAANTFMHEAFHANLWIKAKEWYPSDLPSNFQNLSLVDQIKYLDQRGGNTGLQHDYMATKINEIAVALQSYTQTHYPDAYTHPDISFESFKAMAYRGLGETSLYDDYINSLPGANYSEKKNKYGRLYYDLSELTQSKCP